MRIAFLLVHYPGERQSGGVGAAMHSTARALVDNGHDVAVFVPGDSDAELKREGVPVRRVAGQCHLPRWFPLRHTLRALFFSRLLYRGFVAQHPRSPFDLIQATTASLSAYSATGGKTPVSVFVESYPRFCFTADQRAMTLDDRLLDYLKKRSIIGASRAYAPSKLVVKAYQEKEGIHLDFIPPPFLLQNPPRDDAVLRTRIGPEAFLLYFGQIARIKGVDILAEALAKLAPHIPDLRAVFVGIDRPFGDSGRSSMEVVRQKAGAAAARILHVEHLGHEQLYPIIAASRCAVLPSRMDNLPNALQEAMALGAVVIGPNGASFDELITDGVNGFLFKMEDPDSLAACIERVWRMPEHDRQRIGEAAKERIRLFGPEHILPILMRHYEQAMA